MNYLNGLEFDAINEAVERATGNRYDERLNDNRGPESKVFARDEEAKAKAKKKESEKSDDTKEESVMTKISYSLEEWNRLAGVPMMEGTMPSKDSKELDKKNTLKGGEAGLQGKPVQPVSPKETPNHVGDEEEEVLDDNQVAAESVDYSEDEVAEAFEAFLEERGISMEVFAELVAEAEESGDPDEMEPLIAAHEIFESQMVEFIGMIRKWRADKAAAKDAEVKKVKAAIAKAADAMKKDPQGVRAANARGLAYKPGTMAALKAKTAATKRPSGSGTKAPMVNFKKKSANEDTEIELDIDGMSDQDLLDAITIKYNQ